MRRFPRPTLIYAFVTLACAVAPIRPASAQLFWDWGGGDQSDGSGRELVRFNPRFGAGEIVVTAALGDDGQRLYVLLVARRPPIWSIELLTVDVPSGKLVARSVLGTLPTEVKRSGAASASPVPSPPPGDNPPDGVYAYASALSIAPDGRSPGPMSLSRGLVGSGADAKSVSASKRSQVTVTLAPIWARG